MTIHVFTYGSLMFSPVWESVVRGRYQSVPATVDGHARFAIVGETYPGMIALPEHGVQGVVYLDVAPQDVAALDAFEGADYQRQPMSARLNSGAQLAVCSYIYLRRERLSNQPWQPEKFQMHHFLDTYCRARLYQ